ncbi:patatin-like phospholipase domain-containing protein 4 isoform X5 [Herpailurus yagouaroundi]|uniref:patatin-like phospholipase domain-containing protein 4 isoform X5 n=1 Tax=Herpailurus yagouaroundi TaxID=1608482 RepID=UPI001AD661E3|nr:patatin-like phospholipase domain-containing protein 4 isoform X5 [Puma yagouaroundi]
MPTEQVERGAEEQPGVRPQRRPWTPPFGPAGPPLKGKGEKRRKTTSGRQPRRGPSTSARMKHINLSFAACGFLGIYHLGAASALYRHGRKLLKDVKAFAGASAGSLVATVLLTAPERIEECNEFTYKFAEEIRRQSFGALTPGYDFMARLRSGMDLILPANAHELAHNRLHVSITNTKTRQNYLVSKFSSREDLIKKWVDGGLTNGLPILPVGRTVTISPFSGRLDISPQDKAQLNVYVNVAKQDMMLSVANLVRLNQALFPPSKRKMESLYQHGFGDAIKFLLKENWFE